MKRVIIRTKFPSTREVETYLRELGFYNNTTRTTSVSGSKIYRSSITGKFVKDSRNRSHPKTKLKETVKGDNE